MAARKTERSDTGGIASGGILPSSSGSPVTRINFQPLISPVPAGFFPDKGRLLGVRTNGLTYGWSTSTSFADAVRRSAAAFEEWDTFIRLQRPSSAAKTWNIARPDFETVLRGGSTLDAFRDDTSSRTTPRPDLVREMFESPVRPPSGR